MSTIESLAQRLPAKEWTALVKKYYELDETSKQDFLNKANVLVNKYKWDNRDPMVLQAELDKKNLDNRDPMVLQSELDTKNKKSYVIPPSIFKKNTKPKPTTQPKPTTDVVEGYIPPIPNPQNQLTDVNMIKVSNWQSPLLKQFQEDQAWNKRAAMSDYDQMIKKWYYWNYTTSEWKKNPWVFQQFKNQLFDK